MFVWALVPASGAEIIVATFFVLSVSLERVNNPAHTVLQQKNKVQEPGVSSQCIITAHRSA
jgi:hypothetical protein